MPETKRVRRSAQPAQPAPRQRAVRLFNGDSVEVLRQLADNSVDSVVCDPPYGLSKEPDMAQVMRHWLAGDDYKHKGGGFMGKSWDSFVPGPAIWRECLRVLKPGGHLLAFFGSRTYDMGTLAIRLAGFEIRDQIMWVYGSGFPKSLDVSKAIDKAAGAERDTIGTYDRRGVYDGVSRAEDINQHDFAKGRPSLVTQTAPATDEAKQWEGWGTALKPAHEPICVARKPMAGTVAANVLAHGTGGLNIDGCRIGDEVRFNAPAGNKPGGNSYNMSAVGMPQDVEGCSVAGRWPANFVHDGLSEEWSRYFYCAKASKSDRNYGLSGEDHATADLVNREEGSAGIENPRAGAGRTSGSKNPHPTVKPIALMEWLVRLVTPPGGVVLDPFMGSGSSGIAAVKQGFKFVGVELSQDYFKIAQERIGFARSDK